MARIYRLGKRRQVKPDSVLATEPLDPEAEQRWWARMKLADQKFQARLAAILGPAEEAEGV
jgi:hypothetical protein